MGMLRIGIRGPQYTNGQSCSNFCLDLKPLCCFSLPLTSTPQNGFSESLELDGSSTLQQNGTRSNSNAGRYSSVIRAFAFVLHQNHEHFCSDLKSLSNERADIYNIYQEVIGDAAVLLILSSAGK